MIAINKHSSKLKIWSIKMPNAPYSNRYHLLKKDRMNINDLISDRNRELYEKVNKVYTVELIKTKEDTWSSNINENKAIISYCDTKYPESCFVHELLHFDTQINGYKRLRVGFSGFDQTDYFGKLMTALDNELQHHKMFPKFLKLGYPKEQFYIDNDTETENYLRSYLTKKVIEFKPTFLRYLTLIAPGGLISDIVKDELKEKFKLLDNNKYRAYFDHIDKQFYDWTNTTSLDAEPFLKEMFIAISGGEFTWLGYGTATEFPNNGFFVDKVFAIKQP
jgi:hypothetical protein